MKTTASPRPNDEMPKDSYWPFPTKDNPLKPWTPSQVKEYNDKNTQESPF